METDPNTRLAEIKAKLAEIKQERDALRAERAKLRAALGLEPRGRGAGRDDDPED